MTDGERILSKLRAERGEWVENLYGTTACMVHSRVAELRRKGYVIECKRFGVSDFRYRLVKEPEGHGMNADALRGTVDGETTGSPYESTGRA